MLRFAFPVRAAIRRAPVVDFLWEALPLSAEGLAISARSAEAGGLREPPAGFFGALRFLGPGFVLSAAVVGSGELIATTALGARAGFQLLWVILLSCLVKVAVQMEYGRHAIVHGVPTLAAWNAQRGWRLLRVHWAVYAALLFLLTSWFGVAGILGAASQVVQEAFPWAGSALAVAAPALLAGALVFHARYEPVEILAGVLNAVFLAAVLYCNFATRHTPYQYGLGDVTGGLTFGLPQEGAMLALAVFGITGVGAGEIAIYPYWCLEKGYAAWTGRRDGTPAWERRAQGWIRVMKIDALLSLALYTAATCAFYFLGAAVLSRQPALADGSGLVLQLSGIFTHVLGSGSGAAFLLCAVTVLFSTLFANTAGLSRLWADAFAVYRIVSPGQQGRRRSVAVMAFVIPGVSACVYWIVRRPLALVIFMGAANALFLLVVATRALLFRYRAGDDGLPRSRWGDAALWVSVTAIGLVSLRMLWSLWWTK